MLIVLFHHVICGRTYQDIYVPDAKSLVAVTVLLWLGPQFRLDHKFSFLVLSSSV